MVILLLFSPVTIVTVNAIIISANIIISNIHHHHAGFLQFNMTLWVNIIPSSPFSHSSSSSSSSWRRRYGTTLSLGLFNLKWKRSARLWSTVHKFRRLGRHYFKLLIDRCDWRDFCLIAKATVRLSTSALIRAVHRALCLCSRGQVSGFNFCPLSIGLARKKLKWNKMDLSAGRPMVSVALDRGGWLVG